MRHLAEINIARLRFPIDDPRVAPFADAIDRVNAVADRSPGFVWRFTDDGGSALATRVAPDPEVIVNLSVWEDVAALEGFVWTTVHRHFYARRAEWFDVLDSQHFAMWWVTPGTRPTPADGMARLARRMAEGDGDDAFGWSHLPAATRWRAARCTAAAA